MRLFLAVAVLMLALVAYTEAQDTDPTFEDRFNQFREKVTEMGKNMAEGAKNAYDRVHNSEVVTNARTTVADWFEKFKSQVTGQ